MNWFSNLTSAQVGSATRWVIVNVGTFLAAQGIAVGFDWVSVSGAAASVVMLLWSFVANAKKVS